MKERLQQHPNPNCFKERWTCSLPAIAAVALALLWARMAPAQTHTVLKSFGAAQDGQYPEAGLVLSGTTLYGTTYVGGVYYYGTVFKMNTDGTGHTVLKSFNGSDGRYPEGSLVLSGSTLYGTTQAGGSSSGGTAFKMNTDGTGYTVLKNFTGSDGSGPWAGLVLSGTTLYGTTSYGGSSGYGTVFKVNTDGTSYTVLKSFTGSDGKWPKAALVLSGGTLYGTTLSGGDFNYGTVFKVNTDGMGYTVLWSFADNDGWSPWGGLVLSGGTLYGTTYTGGGSFYNGTVFNLNTDGTGYVVLKVFPDNVTGFPWIGGLILSDGTLYGTTYNSDCDDERRAGSVFQINTDGTGYTALHIFAGGGGWGPMGTLVLSGRTLYGTTVMAGNNFGNGTVFRIDLPGAVPPVIDCQPQGRVNMVGTTTSFSVTATSIAPLTCQWRKNGVNLAEGAQPSGATISGTTTTDLMIANVQMSDAGDYTVLVANDYGSVTSSVAALTVQGSCSFISNGFGFNLSGMAGQTVVIEASTNLTSWTPLLTNSLLTGWYFNDCDSTNFAQRFYRVRLTP
jgi:uncharacterized repeat protein (TIGR03803 family)